MYESRQLSQTNELITVSSYPERIRIEEPLDMIANSGLLTVSADGIDKVSMSYLGFQESPNKRSDLIRPLVVVRQGGPSSPSTLYNAHIFSGTHSAHFDIDGQLQMLRPNPFLLEVADVVNFDAPMTGAGTNLDPKDPTWAFGVEQDGKIFAAAVACYCSMFYPDRMPPIIWAVSSYGAVGANVSILKMAEQGIDTKGLAIISGLYDKRLNSYDYAQTHDPEPYIHAIGAMAVANWYHRRSESYWKRQLTPDEVYNEANTIAVTSYAEAVTSSNSGRREAAANQLADIIGLTPKLIQDEDLMIDPGLFRRSLLPQRILSGVESRLTFSVPRSVRIDPALDIWEPQLINEITRTGRARGYGEAIVAACQRWQFQGILDLHSWPYTGLWAEGNLYKGMERLHQVLPDLRVMDIRGYYDLNNPTDSNIFWRQFCEQVDYQPYSSSGDTEDTMTGIDGYRIGMGHQANKSVELTLTLRKLAVQVVRDANRSDWPDNRLPVREVQRPVFSYR